MQRTEHHDNQSLPQRLRQSRQIQLAQRLKWFEVPALLIGVLAVSIHTGLTEISSVRIPEVSWVTVGSMSWIAISRVVRMTLIPKSARFVQLRATALVIPLVWLAGIFGISSGAMPVFTASVPSMWSAGVVWTELMLSLLGIFAVLNACRQLARNTHNSAVLLVASFLVVIAAGTVLLKLPVCRAGTTPSEAADWDVALFTATSAGCVTGLVVEPTGSYWSPVGHAVIFGLFQIGGLGILTFGAFVAVLSGRRSLQFREARTLREMLDAESVQDSRRLVLTILGFTICTEALGAVLLMGLWPEQPTGQRVWYAVFHSVSAFCNAGFSLQDDGFQGLGSRWQVWGPLTTLIVLGGLGFPVVYDLWTSAVRKLRGRDVTPLFRQTGVHSRLSVHSRLVLWSATFLLVGGAVLWFVLESLDAPAHSSVSIRAADAWFQSVTFRTAGFNTVDHGSMAPATKLLGIFLMFIGAAPGSTGGGVKTVVFALTLLNIWAVFRGRERVEIFGRRIPAAQVSRALSMIAIGLLIILMTTGLLTVFEQQPERFLDHLYEATSAFATVGVSAGVTADLSLPSRLLICGVMFLGRVGPITLLLAMALPPKSSRYDYPEEVVTLG